MKGKSTEDEQQKSGENDKSKVIIGEIQSKWRRHWKQSQSYAGVVLAITCSRWQAWKICENGITQRKSHCKQVCQLKKTWRRCKQNVSRKSRLLDACLLMNFKPSPERREKLEWFTPLQTNGFDTGNRREKRNSSFRKFPEVSRKKETLLIWEPVIVLILKRLWTHNSSSSSY